MKIASREESLLFQTTTIPRVRTTKRQKLIEQEVRIELPIQVLKKQEIASIYEAARVYDVPRSTLRDRLSGAIYAPIVRANGMKLD
jgi:hypothetical protein